MLLLLPTLTLTLAASLPASSVRSAPYLVPLPRPVPAARSSASGRPSSARSSSVTSADAALQKSRKTILDLVNQERRKKNLKTVKQNTLLDATAQAYAKDMVKRNFFSHRSPEGHTPETRLRAAGYFTPPCNCAVRFVYGENIASGQKDGSAVMTDWMNSKVHRTNILKADFLEMGVGNAGAVWVQIFGGIHVKQ